MQIQNVLSFIEFLAKFRQVERKVYFSYDPARAENDAEHSWQLAVLAWYIISQEKLSLDLSKVMQYCLVHDLVEIYAGDVYAYTPHAHEREGKAEKEEHALEKIISEFPEFTEMHEIMKAYERREDEESRFVYALDKMLPDMNILTDSWYGRHQVDATYEKMRHYKDAKIASHPTTQALYEQFLAHVQPNKETLFPKEKN